MIFQRSWWCMNYNMLSRYGSKKLLQGLLIRDDNHVTGFKACNNLSTYKGEKKISLDFKYLCECSWSKIFKNFCMNSSLLKLFLSYRTGFFSECTIPNTYIVDVVFQSLSHVQPFATKWTATCQAPLSFTTSWNWLKFMSIVLVMLSSHLILCRPPPLFQSFPASGSFPMQWLFASGGQSTGASV